MSGEGACSACGEPVEVERPNDDGLTVSVCTNEDCVLQPGVSVGERARSLPNTSLAHALETAESALRSSKYLEGLLPVDGDAPTEAVEGLEETVDALRAEKRRRENASLGDYEA